MKKLLPTNPVSRAAAAMLLAGTVFQAGAQTGTAPAAPVGPASTLVGAAQKAVSTNPQVQEAWHAFQAAEQEEQAARGKYFPRVDLGASAGVQRFEEDRLDRDTDYEPAGVNLTITQLLYDGFATSSNVSRLDWAKRARYFEVLNAAESASLDAVKAYEDVRRYRELVALAEQNVRRHQEVSGRIREKVEAGVGRAVDQEQSSGRLALAESNLIIEQNNLHDVSARYQRVIGEWPAENLAPATHGGTVLPSNLVAALKSAYGEHPALSAASENVGATEEQARNRRSAYHPRLDLRLRGDYGDDLDRIEGQTTDARAEVVLSYNLFNGGSDRAAVAQAGHLIEVAQDQLESTCRDVRQNLRIAYNNRQRIAQQLNYLKVHKDTTDKARNAYLDQFQIGQRSLLDLLDTENEYFQAQRAYINGSYDYSIASASTLAGMGRLTKSIGLARADLPALDAKGKQEDGNRPCGNPDAEPVMVATMPAAPAAPAAPVSGDRDRDGVRDADDLCPDTPANTPVDGAGCAKKEAVVLSGVTFAFNSTVLTEPSKGVLNNAARILRANPSVRVEVAGHTDNVGSAEFNQRLSQGRAGSVVSYLQSQGVGADRLQAKGYGLAQPKATNDTAEGRAINRRVEFRILGN